MPSSDTACQPWSTSKLAEHLNRWQSGAVRPAAPALSSDFLTKQEAEQGKRVDSGTPTVRKTGARAPRQLPVLLDKRKYTLKHSQNQHLVFPHLWSYPVLVAKQQHS